MIGLFGELELIDIGAQWRKSILTGTLATGVELRLDTGH
jgi:hypothetical protein